MRKYIFKKEPNQGIKIAFTIWEDRISPVFDSAHLLLVAEIENGKIIKKDYQTFNPEMPSHLVDVLTGLNVSILICGVVSEIPAGIISSGNVKLKEVNFMPGYYRSGLFGSGSMSGRGN